MMTGFQQLRLALSLATAAVCPLASASPSAEGAREVTASFAEDDFSGAISLNGCSGSLVRFHSSTPEDHALALTNGHCHEGGRMREAEVLVDRPAFRDFKLLRPDGTSLALVKVDRLLYATMTGTDVALYRLKLSYQEIGSRYGTEALTIASQEAPVGTPLRLVSGFWRQVYHCSVGAYVPELKEGDWTFTHALRYAEGGCEIVAGTSGSPLIDEQSGEVIGINNTKNRDGERCSENNPCEVGSGGDVLVRPGQGYGADLTAFYGCLREGNMIDLGLSGCRLAKP